MPHCSAEWNSQREKQLHFQKKKTKINQTEFNQIQLAELIEVIRVSTNKRQYEQQARMIFREHRRIVLTKYEYLYFNSHKWLVF